MTIHGAQLSSGATGKRQVNASALGMILFSDNIYIYLPRPCAGSLGWHPRPKPKMSPRW